jgi:AAA domain/Bifunctional DNA primase/polymerase, N-terminal
MTSPPTRPTRRLRTDDERSDEFLAECGRESVRLGLAVAWTVGIRDLKAHTPGPWKRAKPFPDPENAAAIYVGRCRTRNPIHPVGDSNIFGIDFDGPVDELRAKYEIPELPETVRVVTRRGEHIYLFPPVGRAPIKIEIKEDAVTETEDGVLIGAGSLHRSGHVYRYDGAPDIATAPVELYDLLLRLARETSHQFRERLKADGPIQEPGRRHTVFHFALELAHDGLDEDEIMPSMLALNRRCEPPLSEEQIRGQVRGAVVRARKKPRDAEQVRSGQKAERLLDEFTEQVKAPRTKDAAQGGDAHARTGPKTKGRQKKPALFLPFAAIHLSGPPRWLWRGKIPVNAVTLLAGRPKLGKSLLSIWIAAQLSRGLLEGSYDEPARSLIIAAEDPPDPIVKGRLIAASADQDLVGTLVTKSDQDHQRPSRSS